MRVQPAGTDGMICLTWNPFRSTQLDRGGPCFPVHWSVQVVPHYMEVVSKHGGEHVHLLPHGPAKWQNLRNWDHHLADIEKMVQCNGN